jgi:hypothetical protein
VDLVLLRKVFKVSSVKASITHKRNWPYLVVISMGSILLGGSGPSLPSPCQKLSESMDANLAQSAEKADWHSLVTPGSMPTRATSGETLEPAASGTWKVATSSAPQQDEPNICSVSFTSPETHRIPFAGSIPIVAATFDSSHLCQGYKGWDAHKPVINRGDSVKEDYTLRRSRKRFLGDLFEVIRQHGNLRRAFWGRGFDESS